MADGQQWYMAISGHQVGPVAADEIISRIRDGSLKQGAFVYAPGMRDWAPVEKVETFAGVFRATARRRFRFRARPDAPPTR